ncbi:HIRAN domain-containing protein [Microcella alkaliphila]|uniref:HIRAN domain-containing protein n=1 Tax=Microcella alkaliphila TaxID=279828 RepID=UPI00130027C6|nr:HIRAN domain-containing protein [Microcella alkaliphila]
MSRYLRIEGGDIDVAVKGTSYRQRHVPKVGSYWFTLAAEPSNAYDANAVAVVARKAVGYLPRDLARVWSPLCRSIGRRRFVVPGEVRLTVDGKARWILLWLPDPSVVASLLK